MSKWRASIASHGLSAKLSSLASLSKLKSLSSSSGDAGIHNVLDQSPMDFASSAPGELHMGIALMAFNSCQIIAGVEGVTGNPATDGAMSLGGAVTPPPRSQDIPCC